MILRRIMTIPLMVSKLAIPQITIAYSLASSSRVSVNNPDWAATASPLRPRIMANGINAQPILGEGNRMVLLYHSKVR